MWSSKKENSEEIEGGKPGSIWTPCSIAVIKEGQNMGREYTACPDEVHFSASWEPARKPAGVLEIILKSLYMVWTTLRELWREKKKKEERKPIKEPYFWSWSYEK